MPGWRSAAGRKRCVQARANVAAARARLSDAQVTFTRTLDLSEKKLISRQALDELQASLDTARADLDVAQQALALAVEGPRSEDIEEARAMLKASEAQLALAREVLKDTELYAPAAGVIRNRMLEPGEMASPQTPVLTLALTDPVWVRAYASGELPGQTGARHVGRGVHGQLSRTRPTRAGSASFRRRPSSRPRTWKRPNCAPASSTRCGCYVCNPQDELRLGMPATVTIPLDQPKPEPGHAN